MFQSFQQADMSTTRKYGGTGLGLAISKKLTELMGGEVGVDSKYGVGSTFWMTVKVYHAQSKNEEIIAPLDLRQTNVLVVDDNESARIVIQEMLSSMTFNVKTAESGKEALFELATAEIENKPYKIVYLDWRMPEMDGIQTAEKINELKLNEPPKIIMVTAFDSGEIYDKAMDLGIKRVITKPLTPSSLFDVTMSVMSVNLNKSKTMQKSYIPINDINSVFTDYRILLVEDNEDNQEVAIGLLSNTNIHVDVAWNGKEAIEKINRTQYSLVLMDMQMPIMDGLSATRKIRSDMRFDKLPIIAMTANVMQCDRDACLDAGMNDFVAKPIDPEQLFKIISRWLPLKANFESKPDELPKQQDDSSIVIEDIDTKQALKRALGNKDNYISLLNKFVNKQADAANRISDAIHRDDIENAELIAHTLKGLAGNIGADKLVSASSKLEKLLEENKDLSAIDNSVIELSELLDKTIANIKKSIPTAEKKIGASKIVSDADRKVEASKACKTLVELLENSDNAATDYFEDHVEFISEIIPAEIDLFRTHIENFDFDAACNLLNKKCDEFL